MDVNETANDLLARIAEAVVGLDNEADFRAILAGHIASGEPLTEELIDRCFEWAERVHEVRAKRSTSGE